MDIIYIYTFFSRERFFVIHRVNATRDKGVIQIEMTQNTEKAKTDGQVVVFTLGKEKYGIEISSVKEIVKWTKITELPQMPDEIWGVLKLRDQVIPVISLRKQFGWPEADNVEDTKIIILDIDNSFLGINVDDVDEVVHVPSSAVEFPSALTAKAEMIYGIAKLQKYLLILLDIRAVFSPDVIDQIAENDVAPTGGDFRV